MIDLINNKKFVNQTIDEIRTEISRLARKMCVTRPELKVLTTSKERLAGLFRALSKEYFNVRDYI